MFQPGSRPVGKKGKTKKRKKQALKVLVRKPVGDITVGVSSSSGTVYAVFVSGM